MTRLDNCTSHTSDSYDQQIRKTIPHYEDIHGEILRFVRVQNPRPGPWLDTGCGTGIFVRKALEIFPDTEFFIADPSPAMLEQAKENLKGCHYTLLGTSGTADLPPATDRRFEVITAIQCHHYLSKDERIRAIRACHTLLTDGGLFITSENIRPFTDEGRRRSLEYWRAFQKDAGRSEDEVMNHLSRFDREYFPITLDEHLQNFRDAGFAVTEMFWLSYMQAVFWCRR